jgi:hypothetical protein
MFPELQDYGIIFLCVALFGFIILDIYKTGRDLGIPNFYKSHIEQFFHYISVAILVFSYSLVAISFILLTAPNQENVFTNIVKIFFTFFERSHELGIISTESYEAILKFFIYSAFFSIYYLIFYSIVLILGLFSRYNSRLRTNVYLKGKNEPIKFVGLITETDDFFFFEKEEGFQLNLWKAIRKDDIACVETITAPTRFNIMGEKLINWIRKKLTRKQKTADKIVGSEEERGEEKKDEEEKEEGK